MVVVVLDKRRQTMIGEERNGAKQFLELYWPGQPTLIVLPKVYNLLSSFLHATVNDTPANR
jgi:hypothetical protein